VFYVNSFGKSNSTYPETAPAKGNYGKLKREKTKIEN